MGQHPRRDFLHEGSPLRQHISQCIIANAVGPSGHLTGLDTVPCGAEAACTRITCKCLSILRC